MVCNAQSVFMQLSNRALVNHIIYQQNHSQIKGNISLAGPYQFDPVIPVKRNIQRPHATETFLALHLTSQQLC